MSIIFTCFFTRSHSPAEALCFENLEVIAQAGIPLLLQVRVEVQTVGGVTWAAVLLLMMFFRWRLSGVDGRSPGPTGSAPDKYSV